MKRIVIAEFMDLPAVQALSREFEVLYDPALVDDPVRMAREVGNADAVIVRNRTQVRGSLLKSMARTTVVGRLGVGLDNIDVAACEARGMRVIPASGANALAVAEYVVGTAMLLLRGVYQDSAAVASGAWPRAKLSQGRETAGKALGLVGFGSIGQLTARLAQALAMNVIAYDPTIASGSPLWTRSGVEPVGLDDLLSQADVVSLHVPLVDSTKNLLSAERIGKMKRAAVLINTARGGIVDEDAVAQALRAGALGGAAFDVFGTEPLVAGSAWEGCPNVVLTPHVAGVTFEANKRVSTLIAAEVARALK